MTLIILSLLNNLAYASVNPPENDKVTTDTISVKLKDGKVVKFNIDEAAQGKITMKVLQDLATQNSDAGVINIHNIVYAKKENSNEIQSNEVQPSSLPGNVVTFYTYTYTSYNNRGADNFIISVAKGETKKLTSQKTVTLSASISGGVSSTQLGITGSISSTYTTEISWSGPPEGSSYNSRMYYWTGYTSNGTWIGSMYDINYPPPFPPISQNSGTFKEPSYYVEWSKDILQY